MKQKYGFKGTPTAVIIRPDGTEVDRIVGSNALDIYLAKLRAILKRV